MGFLSYDSPIMKYLNKMTDLVILNLLTFVFCLPVVTIGASVTASHYAALRLHRKEGYVTTNFWKSFKENLAQSTLIWGIFLLALAAIGFGIYKMKGLNNSIEPIVIGVLFALFFLWCMLFVWVFPLQSRFANTIGGTFRNAFRMAILHFLKTLCMLGFFYVLAFVIMILPIGWYSLLFLFGIAVPIYLCAMQYDKIFEELEEIVRKSQKEE